MDTFGVTAHGVCRELAFAANPKYKEPQQQACRQCGCAERWLDPDLLRADGQALGSHWRWSLQRQADVRRPTGPHDRFRFPVTTAMDIGWSLVDPALNGAHFLCNERRSPLTQSDVFRVWHEQMMHAGEDLSLRTRKPLDLAELTPKLRCIELPESSSVLTEMDKQAWIQHREDQLLEGVLKLTPGYDAEPIGMAERLRQQEMERRAERQKKRSQREGSRILREQMETMRFRKDMQPPAHARPKVEEEPEPPSWKPPIILPVTRTHVLPGQMMLHGTKKVLFSELLPHQKETEATTHALIPVPKQTSGQRMLAMQRMQYPLGSHISQREARGGLKSKPLSRPLVEQFLSDRPKEETQRVLPLVRGVPIHRPGDAPCEPIRDTSMQGYQDSSLPQPLDPSLKKRLAMQRREVKKHAKMHIRNQFVWDARAETTSKQLTNPTTITFDVTPKAKKFTFG